MLQYSLPLSVNCVQVYRMKDLESQLSGLGTSAVKKQCGQRQCLIASTPTNKGQQQQACGSQGLLLYDTTTTTTANNNNNNNMTTESHPGEGTI